MNEKFAKADARAREAEQAQEAVEKKLATLKFDFDEYKKYSGKEIQRITKERDDLEKSKEDEKHDLKQKEI